jgi:4-hydroxybenzoate polyprenyltransferase
LSTIPVNANESAIPVVIDVEGALLRGDPIWEDLLRAARRRPGRVPALLLAALRGQPLPDADQHIEPIDAPLDPTTVALIEKARSDGRPVFLSSGQPARHAELARRVGAELRPPPVDSGFDYIGGDRAATPLWSMARQAVVVNPGAGSLRRIRHVRADVEVVRTPGSRSRALLRGMRPHQWAKNTLLFLPALAAHLPFALDGLLTLAAAFIAFSALASAVYLLNDVVDLPNDRAHPTKRLRPLAAGELSIPLALGAALGLTIGAAAIAIRLPTAFQALLGGYVVLTTAYSLALKKRPILDVITLASLYTTRVMAGAAAVSVPLSRWFLAFSVFLFFSLALVKRVVELGRRSAAADDRVPGRGYRPVDVPVLTSLGTTAVMASALVYCLYITGDEVGALYSRPDILWAGLPILLYWHSRLWLLAGRGALHDDPVVFALRDHVSRALALAFLVVLWFAA